MHILLYASSDSLSKSGILHAGATATAGSAALVWQFVLKTLLLLKILLLPPTCALGCSYTIVVCCIFWEHRANTGKNTVTLKKFRNYLRRTCFLPVFFPCVVQFFPVFCNFFTSFAPKRGWTFERVFFSVTKYSIV